MKIFIILSIVVLAEQCCIPHKYEGTLDILIGTGNADGTGSLNMMSGRLTVDTQRRRQFYLGTGSYNGYKYSFKHLHDFQNAVMYAIDESGACAKLPEPMPWLYESTCFDNSSLVKTGQIGLGNNRMSVSIYEFKVHDTLVTLSVDPDCMMVDSVMLYNRTTQAMRLLDVTTKISDESVLEIPEVCKHV